MRKQETNFFNHVKAYTQVGCEVRFGPVDPLNPSGDYYCDIAYSAGVFSGQADTIERAFEIAQDKLHAPRK